MQLVSVTQAAVKVGQFANLLRVYHALKVFKQEVLGVILLAGPVILLLLSSDMATVATTIRAQAFHNPWR